MPSQKPVIHGRDHNPGGSDPISGISDAIRYDVLNSGDWLDVATSTNGTNGYGLRFDDTSASGIAFLHSSGATGSAFFVQDSGGHGFLFGQAYRIGFDLESGGEFDINDSGGAHTLVKVDENSDFHVYNTIGGVATESLRVSGGVVHTLTGSVIVADL